MSLLTILQSAQRKLKIASLSAFVGSTSSDALLLLELAQEECELLSRRHDWQNLVREKTFTTTAAAAQTGAIPTDFGRICEETVFNRSTNQTVMGPLSSQEWQFIQANGTGTIYPMFRIRGSSFLMTPTPPASQTVAYEYITSQWCESSGGTGQSAWAADSDIARLPEALIIKGVMWRWLERQGLSFETLLGQYEQAIAQYIQDDGGRRTIDMTMKRLPIPGYPGVPEGSWSI